MWARPVVPSHVPFTIPTMLSERLLSSEKAASEPLCGAAIHYLTAQTP